MNTKALQDLLFRIADDKLIVGHRNSEWCAFGPIVEEDIAFASMAQDELGHSLAYYRLLEELGCGDPDQLAFNRQVKDFRSCQLLEFPIGEYDFSLVRHFFWDVADSIRQAALKNSSYAPVAQLASKILREEKYHLLHARTWMIQLGKATEESKIRIQTAVNEVFPMAFSIFEPTEFNQILADEGIQPTEQELQQQWLNAIAPILQEAGIQLPNKVDSAAYMGGRKGYHSDYLAPLLKEMTEVFATDPTADW